MGLRSLQKSWAIILCLVFILAATVWSLFQQQPASFFGQAHDDALMMSSAKALAEGRGYIMPSVPESPRQTKYPILYPWLLSLVWRRIPAFPSNLAPVLWLSAAFSCLALAASYFFLKTLGMGRWLAVGMTAFCGLHPSFLFHGARVMADVPMMAFLLTIAVLAQRAVEQERAHRLMLLIGLLAGAAMLLRTIGFTLILAVAAACLYRKRHGPAIAFLSTCVPVVAAGMILQGNNDSLQAWVEQGGPGFRQNWLYYTSYLGFWKLNVAGWEILWRMVWKNLFEGLVAIGGYFLLALISLSYLPEDPFAKLVHNAIAVSAAIGVLAGLVRNARGNGWKLIHLVFILYSITILLWTHGDLAARFFLPFLPLFCAGAYTEVRYVLGGVARAFQRRRRPFEKLVAAGLALAIVILGVRTTAWYLYYSRSHLNKLRESRVSIQKEKHELYAWVRNHTDPSERFITTDDGELYLRTGRQGMWPAAFSKELYYGEKEEVLQRDLDHILDTARQIGARYWIRSVDEFFWYSHRKHYSERMDKIFQGLPVTFQSSGGVVQLYDISRVLDNATPAAGFLTAP